MATINSGAIVSINLDALIDGQQLLLTTHWRLNDLPGGGVQLSDLYDSLHSNIGVAGGLAQAYADCQTTDVTDIKVVVQVIHPTRYVKNVRFSDFPDGTVAPAGGNFNPPQCAAVITLQGEESGPTNVGNKHIHFGDPADGENGVIKAAARPKFIDLADALIGPIGLTDLDPLATANPLIFHRAAPASSALALFSSLQPQIRVVRRRTVGQGS